MQKTLKILFHSSTYPTADTQSTGFFVKNMVEGILQSGKHQITLLTMSHTKEYRTYKDQEGLKIIQYPYAFFGEPQFHIGLFNGVKSLLGISQFITYMWMTAINILRESKRQQYDLLHIQWLVPEVIIAVLVKPIHRLPIVVTAQGAEYHLFNVPRWGILFKLLSIPISILYSLLYLGIDHLVFVSQYMAKQAEKHKPFYAPKHSSIIPNCVNPKSFVRSKPYIVKTPYTIITVRRLSPEKHVEDLILAIDQLPDMIKKDIKVWIIGIGPSYDKLQKLINQTNQQGLITLFGYIDNHKLPELYSQADIYINTSTQEGLATTNVESQILGVPGIVTNGFGNDEVVINKKTGLLYEPRNINDLRRKIEMAFVEKEKLKIYHINALKYSHKFSNKKVGQQYFYLYKKVLSIQK